MYMLLLLAAVDGRTFSSARSTAGSRLGTTPARSRGVEMLLPDAVPEHAVLVMDAMMLDTREYAKTTDTHQKLAKPKEKPTALEDDVDVFLKSGMLG